MLITGWNKVKVDERLAHRPINTFFHFQGIKILFFFSFFLTLILPLKAQDDGSAALPVSMDFVTEEVELPKAGSYFNVIKLVNNQDEVFTGELTVSIPGGWRFIGSPAINLRLEAGEEYLFPVRISVPPSVLGGISYMINAELRGKDYYDYNSAYVSVTRISRWEMHLDTKQVYLSEYRPHGLFSVKLNNRGNANEMIKLAFDTGELLEYVDPIEGDSLMYVELPAYRDTTLSFRIRERKDLTYAQRRALVNNWRSSSIYLKATSSDYTTIGGLRVQPLESAVSNDITLRNSPLNVDLTINNLLSYQLPKISGKVNGKIMFPDDQQLQYNLGFYNFYLESDRNQNMNFMNQFRFMLRYNDRNTSVEVGDRMGLGELHTLSGMGVRAQHTLQDKHTVYFNTAHNPFSNTLGIHTGYSTVIKTIAFNAGTTFETNTKTNDGHYSLQLGTTFNFLKRHRVRIYTTTSVDRFSQGTYLPNDTTKIGFAYRLSYHYNGNRFTFRADNTNTNYSFLRSSGINRINMRSVYKLSGNQRIEGIYYRNSYDATRYPYNFIYPSNKNTTDNGHLLYSVSNGDVIYYAGTFLTNSVRKYYNPANDFNTLYKNLQPGVMGSVTFRLGMLQSITPYLRVNTMFVDYSSENPSFIPYQINGKVQYNVGLSYYDKAFKLNAYFSSGEASDIYRTIVVEQEPEVNQSFHLRPYYERYFKKETIRLSAYMNYSYYLPSTRENMIFNITSDFIMPDGWRIFLSGNLYRIVRADEEVGRIASRDINILAGVRKSFDIQQPRLKYYDLVIVGFNDQNGNGVKDETEKPISNVLIRISRDSKKNIIQKTTFSEISLITDPNGEISYEDIPEGIYDLDITALSSLENLYFLNGDNQQLEVSGNLVHYLPLVETYKVKGKVLMDRDPNSNEGKISLEGIRITAQSEDGDTYSTLTDAFGGYMLSLPKASVYEVSIYNVFGEQFVLEQGKYRVQFSANKTINLDFQFREKRRQLQFREGENFFDFNIKRDD